jgi:hypothetical protein
MHKQYVGLLHKGKYPLKNSGLVKRKPLCSVWCCFTFLLYPVCKKNTNPPQPEVVKHPEQKKPVARTV